eukprot:Platyproteum_vivax@DN5729_c0_g1_i1.p2
MPRLSEEYEQHRLNKRRKMEERAFKEAVRREHSTYVSIRCKTYFGQQVFLVGSADKLGKWNVGEAFPLQWKVGAIWEAQLPSLLDVGTEYKFIMKDGDYVVWESIGNHRIQEKRLRIKHHWNS